MARVKDFNRIPGLMKEFAKANRRQVEVGIFEDAPFLVTIGVKNEFGTRITVNDALAKKLRAMARENGHPTDNLPKPGEQLIIPERSFMRSAFDEKAAEISYEMGALMAKVAAGELEESYEALYESGRILQRIIVDAVASGDFAPNDLLTIAIKGHSRPLIGKTGVLETTQGIRVRVVWV